MDGPRCFALHLPMFMLRPCFQSLIQPRLRVPRQTQPCDTQNSSNERLSPKASHWLCWNFLGQFKTLSTQHSFRPTLLRRSQTYFRLPPPPASSLLSSPSLPSVNLVQSNLILMTASQGTQTNAEEGLTYRSEKNDPECKTMIYTVFI